MNLWQEKKHKQIIYNVSRPLCGLLGRPCVSTNCVKCRIAFFFRFAISRTHVANLRLREIANKLRKNKESHQPNPIQVSRNPFSMSLRWKTRVSKLAGFSFGPNLTSKSSRIAELPTGQLQHAGEWTPTGEFDHCDLRPSTLDCLRATDWNRFKISLEIFARF